MEMTQEEINDVMDGYSDMMIEEDRKLSKESEDVLERLSKIISKKKIKSLIDYIDGCGLDYYLFKDIVDIPTGEIQDCQQSTRWFKKEYCDQSCGYTGDDYSGFIYIELPNKQYIKIYYTC